MHLMYFLSKVKKNADLKNTELLENIEFSESNDEQCNNKFSKVTPLGKT